MKKRTSIALLAILLLSAAPALPRRRAKAGGIEFAFELPSNFKIGRFKRGDVFPDAAVFVESSQLAKNDLNSIPVGDVPTIILNVIDKDHFTFLKTTIPKFDGYRTRIEGREAWKLPGFPGPYGDQLFYYIVPIGMGGRSVEIVANRYYHDNSPTHYDVVVERIIATLAR